MRCRVESPEQMLVELFVFVFVVVLFQFLLTTPNQPRAAKRHAARRLHLDDPHTALPLLRLVVSRLVAGQCAFAQEEDRCDSTTSNTSTTAGSTCT